MEKVPTKAAVANWPMTPFLFFSGPNIILPKSVIFHTIFSPRTNKAIFTGFHVEKMCSNKKNGVNVPSRYLHVIKSDISYDQACLMEPLGTEFLKHAFRIQILDRNF